MHPKFIDKELLLFDLDGTLIDSAPDLALSVNFMLRTLNRDEFTPQLIDSWVGNGAPTLVQRALCGSKSIDKNLDETVAAKALSIFLEYYKQNSCVATQVYPDVFTTLKTLQKNGYKMAIITNKPFQFIEVILQKLELLDFFETFIGGDSLEYKKPHPQPLLHLCNMFQISPYNVVMIGDSQNDILAANAAKIESIAVSYGYNYGEDIQESNPTVVVDDFAEILKVLS